MRLEEKYNATNCIWNTSFRCYFPLFSTTTYVYKYNKHICY